VTSQVFIVLQWTNNWQTSP